MSRQWVLGAAVAATLSGAGVAQAALVNDWIADNYSGTGNWADTQSSIAAVPTGTPVLVNNAFFGNASGFHKGINFNGNSFFLAPGTGTAPGGATSWTLAAVYRATSIGAGAPTDGAFWQGSGLIGNEENNSPPDFGLALVSTRTIGGGGFGGGDQNAATITSVNVTHASAIVADAAAGTLTLFQDGVLVDQRTGIPLASFGVRDANGFALGAVTTGGANRFPGLVAELQTYNTAANGATLTQTLLAQYVPEPGSIGLLGLGAVGLLARRRRAQV